MLARAYRIFATMSSKQEEEVTVLVIDDEKNVRKSLAEYLSTYNYHVVSAATGEEGIDRFHSSIPDLVLCDLDMPDMNGLDVLCHILRESPEHPVIVLASDEGTDDVVEAMRMGISDYLMKPIDNMEMLKLSMANSLKRARLVSQNNRYRKNLELINKELEERVEIFHHDQQAGRHVQMSLLPESPKSLCNYQFAHCIIPSLYLSGDSVDYKPISRSKVMFYIADVSGHGSSSAFVTVLLRFRMEQLRREYIRNRFIGRLSPASMLESLNKDMLETGLDKHITLVMGILDRSSNKLTYSVAGHYPLPILLESSWAKFLELRQHSFPLGLVDEAEYVEERISLPGPFTLVMFSDGILETLDMHKIEDKESFLLRAVTQSKGEFNRLKSCLNMENLVNVPDDIAVMSIRG